MLNLRLAPHPHLHAPNGRRGYATSWIQTTATLGFFLSLAVIGICKTSEVRRNADAKPGDALILTKALGVGVIIDDDQPGLTIADTAVVEGNSGTTSAVFQVKLAQAVSSIVTVAYATANGTATAGNDYTAAEAPAIARRWETRWAIGHPPVPGAPRGAA